MGAVYTGAGPRARPDSFTGDHRARPAHGRTIPGPVLVCTDGRRAAEGAVRVGALVAARTGAEAHALAVVEPVVAYVPEVVVPLPAEVEADRERAALARVETQLAEALGPDARWRVDAERGAPPYAIAEAAATRRASLVVLGIGRHAAFDRVFGTETALRVLRLTTCPVLAVTDDAVALPTFAVAAIDFTPASVRAALTALDVLAPGATLLLVHVKPFVDVDTAIVTAWEAAYARRVDALFERTIELLAERRGDVRLESVSVAGQPVEALLDVAAKRGADLLAVGTHGAGFVERLVLGSVATALLRRATCPVLACQQPVPAETARIQRRLTGTADSDEPAGWAELLDDFTARNTGRPVALEEDDPALGAQMQARGWILLGATWDRHDGRVELMLGVPDDARRHFTRSLTGVTAVSVLAGDDGRDAVLRLGHGRGQTLLTLDP